MAELMGHASRLPLIIADANLLSSAGKSARFQKLVRHFQESDRTMDVSHRRHGRGFVPNGFEPGWPSPLELLPMHTELCFGELDVFCRPGWAF